MTNWLRKLSWFQIIALIVVPVTAFAISWSMNGFTAPGQFREAAQKLGLRVTQVCRPGNATYGATRSAHKSCRAMDVGRETPASKIAALRQYGLCGEFHKKGYYGATADHWHISQCSTKASRKGARGDQRSRAQEIREQNRGSAPSASRRRQRARAASIRRENSFVPRSVPADNWRDRAFTNR